MTPDGQTDFVYLSDLLSRRYPELAARLATVLAAHGVGVGVIHGTRDVCCRDCMPVQLDPRRFIQFRYAPDYLRGHEHLITPPEVPGRCCEGSECRRSEIVLDGGNVVRRHDQAILTDKIYRENRHEPHPELRRRLAATLEIERLTLIPAEPGEPLGHADGVVRFVDEGTIVVNDYRETEPRYRDRLLACLRRAGLTAVELPYSPAPHRGKGIAPATGVYVNYLQTERVLLVPAYELPEDDPAARLLETLFPGLTVVPVECAELAREGGVFNCVSWNVRRAETAQL